MSKSYLIILTLFCAVATFVKAQNIRFDRLYDDYGAWEGFHQAVELNDSLILITARTVDILATDSTYNRRFYLSLLDKSGNKIKTNILSYKNEEFMFWQPLIKKGNEYFFLATYNNLDSVKGKGQHAKGIYINGNSTDTVRTITIKYHYVASGNPGFNPSVAVSNGTFLTPTSYNSTYGDSIYLFWSDSLGNVIRVKEYPQIHMKVYKIIETPDKGFLLTGNQFQDERYVFNTNSELVYVGHPERLWYIKIDSIGNIMWQKLLTGPGYELYDTIWFKYKLNNQTGFRDAMQTADGNYVLAGFIENNPYLRKIKEDGDLVWEHKYFEQLNYLDSLKRRAFFVDVIEERGALYVLGYKDTLFVGAQQKSNVTFLMKLTSTGKEVWTRYFNTGSGNYLYNVFACQGGFFLTGSKQDTVPKYGVQDGWLIRVDTNGCLIPGCELRDGIKSVGFPQKKHILIYPNPVNTTLNIQSPQPYLAVELYNTTGNLVLKEMNAPQTIDVTALPQGLYILRIIGKQKEVVASQKVSVLH